MFVCSRKESKDKIILNSSYSSSSSCSTYRNKLEEEDEIMIGSKNKSTERTLKHSQHSVSFASSVISSSESDKTSIENTSTLSKVVGTSSELCSSSCIHSNSLSSTSAAICNLGIVTPISQSYCRVDAVDAVDAINVFDTAQPSDSADSVDTDLTGHTADAVDPTDTIDTIDTISTFNKAESVTTAGSESLEHSVSGIANLTLSLIHSTECGILAETNPTVIPSGETNFLTSSSLPSRQPSSPLLTYSSSYLTSRTATSATSEHFSSSLGSTTNRDRHVKQQVEEHERSNDPPSASTQNKVTAIPNINKRHQCQHQSLQGQKDDTTQAGIKEDKFQTLQKPSLMLPSPSAESVSLSSQTTTILASQSSCLLLCNGCYAGMGVSKYSVTKTIERATPKLVCITPKKLRKDIKDTCATEFQARRQFNGKGAKGFEGSNITTIKRAEDDGDGSDQSITVDNYDGGDNDTSDDLRTASVIAITRAVDDAISDMLKTLTNAEKSATGQGRITLCTSSASSHQNKDTGCRQVSNDGADRNLFSTRKKKVSINLGLPPSALQAIESKDKYTNNSDCGNSQHVVEALVEKVIHQVQNALVVKKSEANEKLRNFTQVSSLTSLSHECTLQPASQVQITEAVDVSFSVEFVMGGLRSVYDHQNTQRNVVIPNGNKCTKILTTNVASSQSFENTVSTVTRYEKDPSIALSQFTISPTTDNVLIKEKGDASISPNLQIPTSTSWIVDSSCHSAKMTRTMTMIAVVASIIVTDEYDFDEVEKYDNQEDVKNNFKSTAHSEHVVHDCHHNGMDSSATIISVKKDCENDINDIKDVSSYCIESIDIDNITVENSPTDTDFVPTAVSTKFNNNEILSTRAMSNKKNDPETLDSSTTSTEESSSFLSFGLKKNHERLLAKERPPQQDEDLDAIMIVNQKSRSINIITDQQYQVQQYSNDSPRKRAKHFHNFRIPSKDPSVVPPPQQPQQQQPPYTQGGTKSIMTTMRDSKQIMKVEMDLILDGTVIQKDRDVDNTITGENDLTTKNEQQPIPSTISHLSESINSNIIENASPLSPSTLNPLLCIGEYTQRQRKEQLLQQNITQSHAVVAKTALTRPNVLDTNVPWFCPGLILLSETTTTKSAVSSPPKTSEVSKELNHGLLLLSSSATSPHLPIDDTLKMSIGPQSVQQEYRLDDVVKAKQRKEVPSLSPDSWNAARSLSSKYLTFTDVKISDNSMETKTTGGADVPHVNSMQVDLLRRVNVDESINESKHKPNTNISLPSMTCFASPTSLKSIEGDTSQLRLLSILSTTPTSSSRNDVNPWSQEKSSIHRNQTPEKFESSVGSRLFNVESNTITVQEYQKGKTDDVMQENMKNSRKRSRVSDEIEGVGIQIDHCKQNIKADASESCVTNIIDSSTNDSRKVSSTIESVEQQLHTNNILTTSKALTSSTFNPMDLLASISSKIHEEQQQHQYQHHMMFQPCYHGKMENSFPQYGNNNVRTTGDISPRITDRTFIQDAVTLSTAPPVTLVTSPQINNDESVLIQQHQPLSSFSQGPQATTVDMVTVSEGTYEPHSMQQLSNLVNNANNDSSISTNTNTEEWTSSNKRRLFVQHSYTDYSGTGFCTQDEDIMSFDGELSVNNYDNSINTDKTAHLFLHHQKTAFPWKLHDTLRRIENDGYSDIIGWLPHGRSFKIFDNDLFTSIVLPRYFVMTKKSSFLRQLNLYGFNRISSSSSFSGNGASSSNNKSNDNVGLATTKKTGTNPSESSSLLMLMSDQGSYYHERFLRGLPHLCRSMKRQKVNGNKIRSASNPDQEPNFSLYPICPPPPPPQLVQPIATPSLGTLSSLGKSFHSFLSSSDQTIEQAQETSTPTTKNNMIGVRGKVDGESGKDVEKTLIFSHQHVSSDYDDNRGGFVVVDKESESSYTATQVPKAPLFIFKQQCGQISEINGEEGMRNHNSQLQLEVQLQQQQQQQQKFEEDGPSCQAQYRSSEDDSQTRDLSSLKPQKQKSLSKLDTSFQHYDFTDVKYANLIPLGIQPLPSSSLTRTTNHQRITTATIDAPVNCEGHKPLISAAVATVEPSTITEHDNEECIESTVTSGTFVSQEARQYGQELNQTHLQVRNTSSNSQPQNSQPKELLWLASHLLQNSSLEATDRDSWAIEKIKDKIDHQTTLKPVSHQFELVSSSKVSFVKRNEDQRNKKQEVSPGGSPLTVSIGNKNESMTSAVKPTSSGTNGTTEDLDDYTCISSNSNNNSGRNPILSFPWKLHRILDKLECEGKSDVIGWLPHGRSFLVRDIERFVTELMPLHFNQSKYSSFQRQLHMYNFQRITSRTNPSDRNSYHHPMFVRGKPDLAMQMQRTRINGNGSRKPGNPETEPNFHMLPPLPGLHPHDATIQNIEDEHNTTQQHLSTLS